MSVQIVAGRANFPERGCVRSTSRSVSTSPARCGWVFDHSRAPYLLRLRRVTLYGRFALSSASNDRPRRRMQFCDAAD
ncbi:MAG: hypothetical protein HY735_13820 [Verrucomicrobia bacterium]|nr:hypothetical protein [Verrucomicrobiota bacterium]